MMDILNQNSIKAREKHKAKLEAQRDKYKQLSEDYTNLLSETQLLRETATINEQNWAKTYSQNN